MLPFCMDFPFCASNADNCLQDLQAQFRHRLSMRKGRNRNKSRKVVAFLRRCPAAWVTPELQDKRWRTQSSRRWCSPIVCATPTTRPSISRPWDVFQSVGTLPCHSRKDSHLDHGYAMTSHSSQGQTADPVLIHVDTELSAKCPSTVAGLRFCVAYTPRRAALYKRPRNAQHSPRKRCSH